MKWILYYMGNSSEYFLIPSPRWEHVVLVSIQVGCQGWGGGHNGEKNCIALYFMFQSILNIFWAFEKINHFHWFPFAENSAKIINLIFEPFLYQACFVRCCFFNCKKLSFYLFVAVEGSSPPFVVPELEYLLWQMYHNFCINLLK